MSTETLTTTAIATVRVDPMQPGADGLIKTLHNPQGITKDDIFFNEAVVSDLVRKWRETRELETWHKIVEETIPLIDTIILDGGFTDCEELDGLRGECVIKLSKVIEKFDPNRGRAFTIFSISIRNFLISYSQRFYSKSSAVVAIEEEFLENIGGDPYINQEISQDFKSRVMSVETRFFGEKEIESIKYYINYFLSDGFATSKSKMCNTATLSFGVTMDQASVLYDYTLIKIRSELMDLNDSPLTDVELMRLNKRWSVIPEMAELIGMPSMVKLISMFGGINITIPSQKDLQKLRQTKRLTERTRRDSSYFEIKSLSEQSGTDAQSEFERVHNGIHQQNHLTKPVFEDYSQSDNDD